MHPCIRRRCAGACSPVKRDRQVRRIDCFGCSSKPLLMCAWKLSGHWHLREIRGVASSGANVSGQQEERALRPNMLEGKRPVQRPRLHSGFGSYSRVRRSVACRFERARWPSSTGAMQSTKKVPSAAPNLILFIAILPDLISSFRRPHHRSLLRDGLD